MPIFAPLPGMTLEHLPGRLVPLRLEPGTVVVRQGDPGDRFFTSPTAPSRSRSTGGLSPSSALAVTSARSPLFVTWRARRPSRQSAQTVIYALDRDDFLAAVTNHAPSAEAAGRRGRQLTTCRHSRCRSATSARMKPAINPRARPTRCPRKVQMRPARFELATSASAGPEKHLRR